MNKAQLAKAVAARAKIKIKDADAVIGEVFAVMSESLKRGEKIQISGFGNFETKCRAARVGRNPHTHEAIEIPAFKNAAFSPSKSLKHFINE